MRRLLFILALLAPALAWSQAGPRLSSLAIEIWPEYDRPAALVILRGVLAEDVKLPAAISMRLPAASGGAAAVAYSASADANLLNLKSEQGKTGDYVAVKFDLPERFFHIEFYAPMATGGRARSFRYEWPGDLAVDRATVVVQEPAAAEGIVVEPNLAERSTGSEGLTYRVGDLGALPAGKAVPIAITYTKSDARPSVDIKGIRTAQAAPSSAAAAPAAPTSNATGLPEWVVPAGAFAALSIVGVLLVLLAWRRRAAAPPAAQRPAGFCTKCGAPLAAGANFCGKCGTKAAAAR
ncbi:MAG TPA: zinc ribbon domain-containing protein [Casimicrobiaceae bacterium]|nr:zinc ribbon domain-containing protein [Casimicrobiaceae bacterium]